MAGLPVPPYGFARSDVRYAIGALVEAVAGEERRGEVGVQDDVQDLDVPEDSVAAADHGLRSERRPGNAEARGELLLGGVVNVLLAGGGDAQVRQRRAVGKIRVEGGEVVVLVDGRRVVFPADSQVQREVREDAEIVLGEQVGGGLSKPGDGVGVDAGEGAAHARRYWESRAANRQWHFPCRRPHSPRRTRWWTPARCRTA